MRGNMLSNSRARLIKTRMETRMVGAQFGLRR